jgi:hypothetical protein
MKINQLFLFFLFSISIYSGFSQTNNCGGAIALTPNSSCITTAYNVSKNWDNQAANLPCNSGTFPIDGWFTFTTPPGITSVTITATTNRNLNLSAFSGSCGSLVQIGCVNAGGTGVTETLTLTVLPSTTYYINLAHNSTNNMTGNICVVYNSTPPANDQCAGSIQVSCGGIYVGSTSNATSTNDPSGTCGTTAGTPGVWYNITGNGNTITASLCGSSYDTKIQLFSGATCASSVCVTGNDDYCSLQSQISWASTLGTNYYIFVGGYSGATGTYSLAITCAIPTPPNCSVYTAPANGAVLTCGSSNLTWNVPVGGGTPTQYLLFFGTDAAATNINNGTNIGNVLTYSPPTLSPNTTYYWRIVPQNGAGSATGCPTFSFTTGNAIVLNDLCGGATPLISGVTINDDNTCATSDPGIAAATCWNSGSINTLWYSINVTGTTLGVLTSSITLVNTQIAVYSGPCASLVQVGCNDDAPGAGCGSSTTNNSQLNLTGLTAGTYYIRVDGKSSQVGTFNIMATPSGNVGTGTGVVGQDCITPISFCANPTSVGNPGYQSTGNICDFGSTGNCTSGEKNALWMQLTATSAGNLLFNIIPNDFVSGNCDAETDYDWVLYRTTGAGATNCASIQSSGGNGELACNYSYLGVTGMSATGNTPANSSSGFPFTTSAGCYDAAFETSVAAAAGDVFLLVIQNFSGSTQGFSLTIPTGGAGISTAAPTQVLWSGGANTTSVSTINNWGGCSAPNCSPGVDGIVAASSAVQPVVAANMSVKSLTINPGATLTINANIKLDVCENFINNGTLICAAGSTVNFNGTGNQIVGGNLTGTNKFSNFMVTKSTGTVNLLSSIEVAQDLTTVNATSILNTNGVDITIGRDFINSHGATTFTGISTSSSLIFNGTAAQIYNPNNNAATPTLTLNNVTMLNTGGAAGVTISTVNTPNMVLSTSGVLTLTSGRIITPNTQEVVAMNTANNAVSTGNTTSFVQGNLRRYLAASATGSFDFPVGHATPGYERANLNFTSAAAAGAIQLLARFDPWGGAWLSPAAPGWTECSTTYNMPYLNNGYWSIDASAASTGLYDLTLYNLGYSNAATGFSIAKSSSAAPTWALNGNCVATPVTAVRRNSMSGFSKMATIQSATILSIELLEFNGLSKGTHNELFWLSTKELDFKNYELESSEDGVSFSKLTTVDPLGQTSTFNRYTYLDFNYYTPVTYYRLKMNDLNGNFRYSQIIEIGNKVEKETLVKVYPNPAYNELYVFIESETETNATIEIKDVLGRFIYKQEVDLTARVKNNYINTSNFADGTYVITINYDHSPSENIKVIINNRN